MSWWDDLFNGLMNNGRKPSKYDNSAEKKQAAVDTRRQSQIYSDAFKAGLNTTPNIHGQSVQTVGQPHQSGPSPFNTDFNPSAHTVNSSVPGDRYNQVDKVQPFVPDPLPQQTPGLADYLNQALGMLGGDAGSIYDQQMAQARQNAASADTSVKGAYAALASELAGLTPQVGSYYDQARNEVQATNAAASGAVNNAYGAAGATQNTALDALGIGDAARASLAGQGNYAANDQAQALSDIAVNGAGNLNANTEHKATAQAFNTENSGAASAYGAALRAKLAQQLQTQLASLQQSQTSARGNQFSQALQLAQALNSDAFNRQQETDLNQYNAAKLSQQATPKPSTKLAPGDLLKLVNKFFGNKSSDQIDPNQYMSALKAFSALNN